jgi:hypothetical protein
MVATGTEGGTGTRKAWAEAMNDYFVGRLARERQADYVREVEHDELVAQARRTAINSDPRQQISDRQVVPPSHLLLRRLLARVAPSRLTTHGGRS